MMYRAIGFCVYLRNVRIFFCNWGFAAFKMRGGFFFGTNEYCFSGFGYALRQFRILRWFGVCGEINVEV
jgi:hypothetical protein